MAARGLGKGLDALIPSAAAQPKTKEKQNVQDAHEAIRPTDINKTPEKMKKYLHNKFACDIIFTGEVYGKVFKTRLRKGLYRRQ